MTNDYNLNCLKTIAKRLARQQRIAHHKALDALAKALRADHIPYLLPEMSAGHTRFQENSEIPPVSRYENRCPAT